MIDTVDELLAEFDDLAINYCHWKSNEKIQATLNGETDLDVLCHRDDLRACRQILGEHGFVKLDEVSLTGYPGIENYVGYDPDSGSCIHVHLHFELTFGTPFLKEYVTPWAPYVLDRRITDPESGVPITDPTTELFLLIVRYSLKIRRYNPIARRSYFDGFLDEYDWLAERADEAELDATVRDLLNPSAASRVADVLDGEPTIRDLIRVGKPVRAELDTYSTYPSWSTTPIALARKVFRGLGKLNREFIDRPYPTRRKLQSRGVEIAIVGIDGSGKSTHLSSLHDWLSWKMDVHTVYFGSGDGPSSLLRYPFKKLNDLRTRSANGTSNISTSAELNTSSDRMDGGNSGVYDVDAGRVGFAKAPWAILLAREKKKKRRRAIRARNRGMIVLMDRYPQNQFADINDGPLLQPWLDSRRGYLKRIAKWETEIYDDLHEQSPDLIIKLMTDPEIAKERKPETPMVNLERKAEIIDSLSYEHSRVIEVDTDQDIDDVLRTIKKEIWKEL